MRKLPTGEELRKRAVQLGVAIETNQSVVIPDSGNIPLIAEDYEIQRRVLDAERHLREQRLWLVAAISAIASVVSAFAAWLAIFSGRG